MKKLLIQFLLYFIFLLCVSVVTMTLTFSILNEREIYKRKSIEIEDTLRRIQFYVKEDSIRMITINKIVNIISRYNSHLDIQVRQSYANEIYLMTIKYDNLDIDLICATITHESAKTWSRTITSPVGAMGLMQIMPTTALFLNTYERIEWTTPEDILFNPIYNIRLGSRYLSMLIGKYSKFMSREEAIEAALAAYNGGEKRVSLWIAKDREYQYLWRETRKYIPMVLGLYEKFVSM